MSTPAPTKRKRTGSPNNEAVTDSFIRSSIWYQDGNIVIQAEDTQYRVHQSILAANSLILKDIMETGIEGESSVDGCPVLRLLDLAHDVTYILKALYSRKFQAGETLPFKVIAAFIRLGGKYEICHIRTEGISRLESEFPATVEHFEECTIEPSPSLILDTVNLARECNVLSILPVALLCCVRFVPMEGILEGVKRDDGSIAMLSPGDRHTCLLGWDKLRFAQLEHIYPWLDDYSIPTPNCTSPVECKQKKAIAMTHAWKPSRSSLFQFGESPYLRFCDPCSEIGKTTYYGMYKVWDALPSYFGLPDWEDLTS